MNRTFTRTALLLAALVTLNLFSTAATFPTPAPVSTEPNPNVVKAAVNELAGLSKQEKKERVREVKQAIKAHKAARKAGKEPSEQTLLLVILAILLPPLAVYLHEGEVNTRFWISLILTLLFFIPGVIYALIVVLGDDAANVKPAAL